MYHQGPVSAEVGRIQPEFMHFLERLLASALRLEPTATGGMRVVLSNDAPSRLYISGATWTAYRHAKRRQLCAG